MNWQLVRRAEKVNPSVVRELLNIIEQPGIISFAGGLCLSFVTATVDQSHTGMTALAAAIRESL